MERSVEASTRVRASGDRAAKLLRDETITVLGGTRLDLVAAMGAAPRVHHEIAVDVGEPHEDDRSVVVPIGWRAVGRERLYPRFVGELVVEHDVDAGARLRLHGTYAVPFGLAGRFGDGLAGRRVVRHCMEDLVRRIATNIDTAAGIDAPPGGRRYAVKVWEAGDS